MKGKNTREELFSQIQDRKHAGYSGTWNRVRHVTTTFSGEYAIFILSDRQRY